MIRDISKVNYDGIVITLSYNFDDKDYEKDINLDSDDVDAYFKINIPSELYKFIDLQELSEDEHFVEFLTDLYKDAVLECYEIDKEADTIDLEFDIENDIDNTPENFAEFDKVAVEKLVDEKIDHLYPYADKEVVVDKILNYLESIK